MKLWKVILTDPIRRDGKYRRQVAIVAARGYSQAVPTLRAEQPECFKYSPAVEVEPFNGNSVLVLNHYVKLPAARVAMLFPTNRT